MLADWTAACGPDDAVVVVPWADAASGLRYIDLRREPFDLAEVSEAESYPAMRRALRSLNAPNSAFLTAKCDIWRLDAENGGDALEAAGLELGLSEEELGFGMASYIDLLPRERSVFVSAHVGTDRLARITRRAARLTHDNVTLELTLRPAVVELGTTIEGYSATLYLTAIAGDPETAQMRWEAALEDVVHLLREREWAVPPGSATIDAGPVMQPAATVGE